MSESSLPLFNPSEIASTSSAPVNEARAEPRILEPQRAQGEMRFEIPDDMLPASHLARLFWNVLGVMNLSAFSTDSGSVEGEAGRSLLSPRMLLTLWLYAISQGVGSSQRDCALDPDGCGLSLDSGQLAGRPP